MTMRAEDIQTPVPVQVPRIKPALWTDGGDSWLATPPQGVQLVALPTGAERQGDGQLRFPKAAFATQDAARAALGRIYPSLADAAANPDGTYNVYNAVLFSEGTWNGDPYDRNDLEQMVRAHHEVGHIVRPWGKLGHDDAQTYAGSHGLPRIGTLDNLRVQTDEVGGQSVTRLYGDVLSVPEMLYHAMEQKGYTTRSPEIYWNWKSPDGQVYPRVMRAVAFLGAEMPANPTLPELFKSYVQTPAAEGQGAEVRVYEDGEPHRYAADLTAQAAGGTLVDGLRLRLTHLKGMTRTGMGRDGKPWKTTLEHHYGEVPGVMGHDGEPLDAYVGPHPDSPHAFMVNQIRPDTGDHDEQKLMLGFRDLHAARAGYLAHMPGPQWLGGIFATPLGDIRGQQASLPEDRTNPEPEPEPQASPQSYAELKTGLARLRLRLMGNS